MKSLRLPENYRPVSLNWQSVLMRYWWVVLLTGLAGAGTAGYFANRQPPTYRANATLVVEPSDSLKVTREIVDSLNTLDRRSVVATLAMVPSSRTVRDRARAALLLTQAQLRPYDVKTALVPDSNTIEVTVEGPNPRLAAALANTVAEESISLTPEYYNIYALKALDWSVVPTEDVGPGLVRKVLVGGLLGILVGLGPALFLIYAIDGLAARFKRRSRQAAHRSGFVRRRNSRVINGTHLVDLDEQYEGAEEPALD